MAVTFQKKEAATIINAYAADVSRGRPVLERVVKDRTVPGVPAASRLGIGKGFNGDIAHAYP